MRNACCRLHGIGGTLGLTKLLLIIAIILIVFGAGKLPQIGRGLGEGIANFRRGLRGSDDEKQIDEKKNPTA